MSLREEFEEVWDIIFRIMLVIGLGVAVTYLALFLYP